MTPDRWLELRVRVPAEHADDAVEALLDAGGRAVWEEGGWQVTHLPDPAPPSTDPRPHGSRGSGAGAPGDAGPASPEPHAAATAVDRVVRQVRAALDAVPAGALAVETRWQGQEDWAEFWKRGLDARRVTPRMVVTPTWIEPDTRPGDLVITLDPKMAFGNAEHGTTRGCLRLLDGRVEEGQRLLDVGAGSAILAIAAVLLGAEDVLALEADPLAIPAARENLEVNGVAARVTLRQVRVTADDLRGLAPRDGVMANMETGYLRPLLPGLVAAVRPGGWLLLSGILAHEWEEVRAAVEALGPGFAALDADGEWRSALFLRHDGG